MAEEKPVGGEKEGEEEKVIRWDFLPLITNKARFVCMCWFLNPVVTSSWRGAVIDTEQATEGPKDQKKEDLPANPEAKPSQESGTCFTVFFVCSKIAI